MSNWKKFKKKLGDFADKTAGKTRELTDTAALKIKIANKEADRDLEYRKLGKLAVLDQLKSDVLDLAGKVGAGAECDTEILTLKTKVNVSKILVRIVRAGCEACHAACDHQYCQYYRNNLFHCLSLFLFVTLTL
jgi:hypothetical protein